LTVRHGATAVVRFAAAMLYFQMLNGFVRNNTRSADMFFKVCGSSAPPWKSRGPKEQVRATGSSSGIPWVDPPNSQLKWRHRRL
jgi:hypothetical protein